MPRALLPIFAIIFNLSSPQILLSQCSKIRWDSAKDFWREAENCSETADRLRSEEERCYSGNDSPACKKIFEQLLCARDNYIKTVFLWQELWEDCTGGNRQKALKYEKAILQTLFVMMDDIFIFSYLYLPYDERAFAVESFDSRIYGPLHDIGALHGKFMRGSLNATQMNVVRVARVWYEIINDNPAGARGVLGEVDSSALTIAYLQILEALRRRL